MLNALSAPQDYRFLLDHLHTAIVLLDQNLCVYYLNSAGESLLEISSARAKQHSILPYFCPPADEQQIRHAFLNTLQTGQPYTSRESVIQVHFKEVHVDYTVTPLSLFSAYPLLLIELDPVDQKLEMAKEEQSQHQHQVTRHLVRSVAHEIKNPLGGIRGATQLLARQLHEPQLLQFTDIIISEVDRLSQLANSLLGSRQPMIYETINIHEPLEHVHSLVRNHIQQSPQLQQMNVDVIRDYDLSLPELYADRHQLIQVFLNICMNAIQSFEEHSDFFHTTPTLILRTRFQRLVNIHGVLHRSALRIDIEDNGIGIPEELLESIFYPLITGRAKGTGLGLSIVQHIIQQHHGMIKCQSETGKTLFSLYLPWEQPHDESHRLGRGR
ncbi:MAG: nitrogen regulation protein NR(II) [Acinetobacter sp.]|nr:nitrogen regulation protein NR(II) [Acinetobacter sp.]